MDIILYVIHVSGGSWFSPNFSFQLSRPYKIDLCISIHWRWSFERYNLYLWLWPKGLRALYDHILVT